MNTIESFQFPKELFVSINNLFYRFSLRSHTTESCIFS